MSGKPLLIVALESEVPADITKRWDVVFTGIGKVNASYICMKAIANYRPGLLINYGTAGGIRTGLDQVVEVGTSVQCDMDVRPLGIALGTTPFDDCPASIRLSDSPICCGTADRFSDSAPELTCDIVDMELFALAKIAWHEKIPLRAFKFISDAADDKAGDSWKNSLPSSAEAFARLEPQLLALAGK
ncbi:MAG: 5'-methylthioadenosine nucleosidase [Candidatus Puniceispirillaceae bacterium]